MSTLQTLRESKRQRLRSDFVPQSRIEDDVPEETNLEWYRRWSRDVTENRRNAGLPDDDPITMEEIVAICKEARTERYAEDQANKTEPQSSDCVRP
jgi:hypothetical protein